MSSQTASGKDNAATRAADSAEVSRTPRVTFYRFIPDSRLPQRADRSAAGSLPTRAFRYCEPVTTAAAFGYYVFPPINFSLIWDGHEVAWTYEGAGEWLPLHTAQYPNFAPYFDERVPEEIRGFSPPFVTALQEPGLVQLWTGIIARTAPGWSLLVRPCANLPRTGAYELYEGIIETDRWFGPLFTNMRLTKTNVPIEFTIDFPVFQVQPLPREALDEQALNGFGVVPEIEALQPEDWDDFYDTVVRPNVAVVRPHGHYATVARKRRKAKAGDATEE
ncbi:DUF6065 family protein [Limobrevibacterium gyesilva]|uniref:DUF6065 family protein n=1 Tax=Limobrevibacterium gyesilva TaxID=2991712 RepID=A0AA41YM38_9PROT|nr:DUF6065 family protein [Limobrevibacterium gyesilva]MCW3475989.1 DUF6065 family protein [Limobrevibacterium gyesilva]